MLNCRVFVNLNVSRLLSSRHLLKQQVRNVPRWAHRRPIKVMFPDSDSNYSMKKLEAERNVIKTALKENEKTVSHVEINSESKYKPSVAFNLERDVKAANPSSSLNKRKLKQANQTENKSKRERKLEHKASMKAKKLEESASEAGVPVYAKLKDKDAKLSKLMAIAKSKNKKSTRSCIVLEGKRLIKDAIQAGYIPEQVFFSRVKDAADLQLPSSGVKLYKIPYSTIELWSDLATPPGVVAFLKTPDIDKREPVKDALPLTIVCDQIRDPGNLGTILRTAAGVGCEKVILTKGCVDLWEPKVLRSGAGAHFRTVISTLDWKDVHEQFESNASVFLADNCQSLVQVEEQSESASIPVLPYFDIDYVNRDSVVLVVGGETEGLSTDSFRFARGWNGARLNIPLSNGVDSLNAGTALAIIVFEIRRQFLNKATSKNQSLIECTLNSP